jgi:hypothetical protein
MGEGVSRISFNPMQQHWLQGVANWFSQVDRYFFLPMGSSRGQKMVD